MFYHREGESHVSSSGDNVDTTGERGQETVQFVPPLHQQLVHPVSSLQQLAYVGSRLHVYVCVCVCVCVCVRFQSALP